MSESMEQLLGELDGLLASEREALRRMDPMQIEGLSVEKVALLGRLAAASREGVAPETVGELARLRELALQNQLLLVHARDLTRGVVETLSPGHQGGRGSLLEVRG